MRKSLLAIVLLGLLTGCGDDDNDSGGADSGARVGEDCQGADDCKAGLACLEPDFRCVILCTPGDEDCGPGIACETAGSVGFCPLPPDPDRTQE